MKVNTTNANKLQENINIKTRKNHKDNMNEDQHETLWVVWSQSQWGWKPAKYLDNLMECRRIQFDKETKMDKAQRIIQE